MLTKILIVLCLTSFKFTAATTCERHFEKVGCFHRQYKLLPDLIVNDRDVTHQNYSGVEIDWNNTESSLHSLACRCSDKARGFYPYFSIGFYGECWAGTDLKLYNIVINSDEQRTDKCVTGANLSKCNDVDDRECAGKGFIEYIYFVKDIPAPKTTQITSTEEIKTGASTTYTGAPTQRPDTDAPTQRPDTNAPTQYPGTDAPTQRPNTDAPTQRPKTVATTLRPDTDSPTQRPDTNAPTQHSDTDATTQRPDTDAPTQRPDTDAPTQRPDTDAPTQRPDTDATTQRLYTDATTLLPDTDATTQRPDTDAPTQRPDTDETTRHPETTIPVETTVSMCSTTSQEKTKPTRPSVHCDWRYGKGIGGPKVFTEPVDTRAECIDACLKLKSGYPDINGATVPAMTMIKFRCRCERRMFKTNRNPKWLSCYFK